MQKDKVFKILPKYLQVSKYSSVVPDTGNTRVIDGEYYR